MQQYFVKDKLNLNEEYSLDEEILHHLKNVLRKDDGYIFRICDVDNNLFLCELFDSSAKVLKLVDNDRELNVKVTVIMSLIKNDHFDFCLQKLTELGIYQIVPFRAIRSVVKVKDAEHKLDRYRKIVKEAAEQSLRSFVPIIPEIISLKDVDKYLSKHNYLAYEKEDNSFIDYQNIDDSLTFVVGPEGGFTSEEVAYFNEKGFKICSLGKRILRAETAAIYVMANIAGVNER